jgi:hypothetical protein
MAASKQSPDFGVEKGHGDGEKIPSGAGPRGGLPGPSTVSVGDVGVTSPRFCHRRPFAAVRGQGHWGEAPGHRAAHHGNDRQKRQGGRCGRTRGPGAAPPADPTAAGRSRTHRRVGGRCRLPRHPSAGWASPTRRGSRQPVRSPRAPPVREPELDPPPVDRPQRPPRVSGNLRCRKSPRQVVLPGGPRPARPERPRPPAAAGPRSARGAPLRCGAWPCSRPGSHGCCRSPPWTRGPGGSTGRVRTAFGPPRGPATGQALP